MHPGSVGKRGRAREVGGTDVTPAAMIAMRRLLMRARSATRSISALWPTGSAPLASSRRLDTFRIIAGRHQISFAPFRRMGHSLCSPIAGLLPIRSAKIVKNLPNLVNLIFLLDPANREERCIWY